MKGDLSVCDPHYIYLPFNRDQKRNIQRVKLVRLQFSLYENLQISRRRKMIESAITTDSHRPPENILDVRRGADKRLRDAGTFKYFSQLSNWWLFLGTLSTFRHFLRYLLMPFGSLWYFQVPFGTRRHLLVAAGTFGRTFWQPPAPIGTFQGTIRNPQADLKILWIYRTSQSLTWYTSIPFLWIIPHLSICVQIA